MTIFPAVDIHRGKAVRLKQGRRDDETVFGDDPVAMARHWQNLGAGWLHVVDLDAAFGDEPNFDIIAGICASLQIPVQIGGGIRSMETARAYMEAGAGRLIVGTAALENPEVFAEICYEYPGKTGVSLDAENGCLKSRGWLKDAGATVEQVLPQLEAAGAAFIIYTDIARDGTRTGLNLDAARKLLHMAKVPVLFAGGVASMDDLRSISALKDEGRLEGIISGRALYDGSLKLEEALAWLAGRTLHN